MVVEGEEAGAVAGEDEVVPGHLAEAGAAHSSEEGREVGQELGVHTSHRAVPGQEVAVGQDPLEAVEVEVQGGVALVQQDGAGAGVDLSVSSFKQHCFGQSWCFFFTCKDSARKTLLAKLPA